MHTLTKINCSVQIHSYTQHNLHSAEQRQHNTGRKPNGKNGVFTWPCVSCCAPRYGGTAYAHARKFKVILWTLT